MKKIIFIIILGVFTLLNAQHIANISNVNYHSRVLDYSNYSGSINKYQNRLYVESEGMIEEFEINTNGALDRISFYEKKGIGINTAFVSGDSLYFFDQDEDSYLINVFNISVSPMQFIAKIDTNISKNNNFRPSISNHYILLADNEHERTLKINKHNLSFDGYIDNLFGLITISDSLLVCYGSFIINNTEFFSLRFYHMIEDLDQFDNNNYIHEEIIGSTGNGGVLFNMKIEGDNLFLLGHHEITVLNISDLDSIATVFHKYNPSQSNDYYTDALIHDGNIYTVDHKNRFDVYNISDQSLLYTEDGQYHVQSGSLCLHYPYLYRNAYMSINTYNIEYNTELLSKYGLNAQGAMYKNGYIGVYDVANNQFIFHSVFDNNQIILSKENVKNDLNIVDFDIKNNSLYLKYRIDNTNFFDIYNISSENLSLVCSNQLNVSYYDFSIIDSLILFNKVNNGIFSTDIYSFNNTELEFLYTIQSQHISNQSYSHNNLLIFKNNNKLQFRDKHDPVTIMYETPIISGIEYGAYFVNDEIFITISEYINKLYNYTDHSITFLDQMTKDLLSVSTIYNQTSVVKDFDSETALVYYIGNGMFSQVGEINENRNAMYYIYFDQQRIVSIASSGVNLYSFDYTVSTDDQTLVKPSTISVYPNPCRSDQVRFLIKNNTKVKNISIYNIKGQLVNKISNQVKKDSSSEFVWNKKDMNGKAVSSGLYLYRADSDQEIISGKMMILK